MRVLLAIALVATTGCFRQAVPDVPVVDAVPVPVPEAPPPPVAVPNEVDAVLAAARGLLGQPHVVVNGRSFHDDCSGFVRGAFSAVDVDVFALAPELPDANGVTLIRAFADRWGALHAGPRPSPGDVVFFDDTYDRNHNGLLDDHLTHVGLVDEVLPDGTIYVIHRSNRGVVRDPMNLAFPNVHKDAEGREINAYLRAKGRREKPGTPHLMGELFAGFGSIGIPGDLRGPRFDELASPPPDEDDLPPPPVPDVP